MILKLIFAQILAFQLTKVTRCFRRVFYHFIIFGFKNEKKLFEEIKGFEGNFIELNLR